MADEIRMADDSVEIGVAVDTLAFEVALVVVVVVALVVVVVVVDSTCCSLTVDTVLVVV